MRNTLLCLPLLGVLLNPIAANAQADNSSVIFRPSITNSAAFDLINRATETAKQKKLTLCFAVTDRTGNLVAFSRMDDAFPGCIDAAIFKAKSASRFARNTILFYDAVRKDHLGMGFIPGILPAVGGIALKRDGQLVGGLGVSGDNSDAAEEKAAEDAGALFH